jgi:hypothetical protein
MVTHRRLSVLTPAELLARAAKHRRMALEARTDDLRDALNRLAIRFALLAAAREIAATKVGDGPEPIRPNS